MIDAGTPYALGIALILIGVLIRGANKYYKCLKCGNVLVLSEDGILYEVPGVDATSLKENLDQNNEKSGKVHKNQRG